MTLRAAIERVGPLFEQKLDHYYATLVLLERHDPAPPFLQSLGEELRVLRREPLSI